VIEFTKDSVRFNYRVAGVCVQQAHVLLHREITWGVWALPGGRVQWLESSRDALLREMEEETGLRVDVGRLLWSVENFFAFDGLRFHELGLYYAMTLPDGSSRNDVGSEFTGFEGEVPIIFRWVRIDRLQDLPLFPAFLRSALASLPNHPVHVIHRDPIDP
jgi:ADP-ribose pyrophosphatase YjhB (NUDIX family)